MLSPLISQLTSSFPQLTGKLTLLFSVAPIYWAFLDVAPNVGQTYDNDKGFFIRQNFANGIIYARDTIKI